MPIHSAENIMCHFLMSERKIIFQRIFAKLKLQTIRSSCYLQQQHSFSDFKSGYAYDCISHTSFYYSNKNVHWSGAGEASLNLIYVSFTLGVKEQDKKGLGQSQKLCHSLASIKTIFKDRFFNFKEKKSKSERKV